MRRSDAMEAVIREAFRCEAYENAVRCGEIGTTATINWDQPYEFYCKKHYDKWRGPDAWPELTAKLKRLAKVWNDET